MSKPASPTAQVVCICGGDGFPHGSGTASRITLVGRALERGGISFHLLHCGPTPTPANTERTGVHDGISFEYTSPLKRPRRAVLRWLVYAAGVFRTSARLIRMRFSRTPHAVYLYILFGPLNLYFGLLAKLLGLPLIQEMCEWWPGEPTCSAFSRWLYRKRIFLNACGVLAITPLIEDRVRRAASCGNPQLRVHRLPSLLDVTRFASAGGSPLAGDPAFLWCGTVDGWFRDVLFLIDALAVVLGQGYECRLFIVGSYRAETKERILRHAAEQGVPLTRIVLTGWVDNTWLADAYHQARGLLLPLWNDDRSLTRMPNKLPEYLSAGRPVVTSGVGAVGDLLADGENALLVPPGNAAAFAAAMVRILDQADWASAVGARGRETCLAHFDYRAQADDLAAFVRSCIDRPVATCREPGTRERVQLLARNSLCALLGLGLIGSGAVRRARQQAFAPGVVTAVYFHKPRRRLFESTIHWLKKHGYVFVSEQDVAAFLAGERLPPRGAVWLSFDDGAGELVQEVLPVVAREQIPVTLYIPSQIVAEDGRFPWVAASDPACSVRHSMTEDDLRAASRMPEVTIGCHTATHAVLPWCPTEHLNREIQSSKLHLESLLGREVSTFSYPNGQVDARSERVLEAAGYSFAVTTESEFVRTGAHRWRIPRFSVADDVFFPEVVCNLVGVWRPAVDLGKQLLQGRWANPPAFPVPVSQPRP